MRSLFANTLVLTSVMLLSTTAWASPIEWVIQDVAFNDGGTASGSFTYDAGTGIYSDINVFTSAGTDMAGATYTTIASNFPISARYLMLTTEEATDLTGLPNLRLIFATGLSNFSGPTSLVNTWFVPTLEATCAVADCGTHQGDLREMVEGEASQNFGFVIQATALAAIPVPAPLLLLGSALLGMGLFRRR